MWFLTILQKQALNGKYRDFAPALNGAAESYKIENENLIAYVSK